MNLRTTLPILLAAVAQLGLAACSDNTQAGQSTTGGSYRAPDPEQGTWADGAGSTGTTSPLRITASQEGAASFSSSPVWATIAVGLETSVSWIDIELRLQGADWAGGAVSVPVRGPDAPQDGQPFAAVIHTSGSQHTILDSGTVALQVSGGHLTGTIALGNTGTYTIDAPVTATCATTEIQNETKPGSGMLDAALASEFCSALKPLVLTE